MGEHFESVRSRNSNERDAGSIRHANSKRGWCGNRNHHGRAGRGAFCTISTDTRLVRRMIPSLATIAARASAPCQLVERIMATNVLADGYDAARDIPKSRRVYRPRIDVEFLTRWQVLHCSHDIFR